MARFRLFGIPVTVDPMFLLGLFLMFSLAGGGRAGLISAAAIGVFTLIHELGHALTARRFGCETAISLNLLVGWASYSSSRPLSRGQRILISALGPLTQITVGLAALGVVFTQFHQRVVDERGGIGLDLWQGLWWAGVAIALLNLLPLWPLDGGHIVHELLATKLESRRAIRLVAMTTIGLVIALFLLSQIAKTSDTGWIGAERARGVYARQAIYWSNSVPDALWASVRGFPAEMLRMHFLLAFFAGLNSFRTLQSLSAADRAAQTPSAPGAPSPTRPVTATPADVVRDEELGWMTHSVPTMPRGWVASPWLLADVGMQRGQAGEVQAALAQVVTPARRWALPDPTLPAVGAVLARLAEPWPVGDPARSVHLLRIAGHHASPAAFLDYAGRLYKAILDPEVLYVAAGSLARRGHPDDAMTWLQRAVTERRDFGRIVNDPDFAVLHHREDFRALLAALPR